MPVQSGGVALCVQVGAPIMKTFCSSLVLSASFLSLVACGTGTTGALDGSWDVTSVGGDEVAPSELVVSGGKVTGSIISKREGQPVSDSAVKGCAYAQNRMTVDISIEGAVMTATFTDIRKYSGGEACKRDGYTYSDRTVTYTVTGKRTRKDPATNTDLNGTWEIQAEGLKKPIAATVKDLAAEVPVDAEKGSKGVISIANGKLSVVFPGGNDGSFNAQQR